MAQDGPRIAEVSPEEFREFAKRYASSPEIGPIQTSLDGGVDEPELYYDRWVYTDEGRRGWNNTTQESWVAFIWTSR